MCGSERVCEICGVRFVGGFVRFVSIEGLNVQASCTFLVCKFMFCMFRSFKVLLHVVYGACRYQI